MSRLRQKAVLVLGIALSLFTLSEVNYPLLDPFQKFPIFGLTGIVICFLVFPLHKSLANDRLARGLDWILALAAVFCCLYLIFEGEDVQKRSGNYTQMDIWVAVLGMFLVLEATRRSIGWILPLLAVAFLAYAFMGPDQLPPWLFPHPPYDLARVASQSFLRQEGVWGMAMSVMFNFVFLFVLFGAFLEASGATRFIVQFSQRVFGNRSGSSAKVAVLGSGLMGSLSGSAVANAVTTGTFTIPMMRSSGFPPHIAGGITAAAASGGALVPPIMGAGAYMMLEMVQGVTIQQIIQAAVIPAFIYYFSLLAIVHFYSKATLAGKAPAREGEAEAEGGQPGGVFLNLECLTFFGSLLLLVVLLLSGYSAKLAVSCSLGLILALILFNRRIVSIGWTERLATLLLFPVLVFGIHFLAGISVQGAGIFSLVALLLLGLLHPRWRPIVQKALSQTSRNGISLISAAACVGIIIAIVVLTGVGTSMADTIVDLARDNRLLALMAIMVCSIFLGMGLPSVVCYLILATMIGKALNDLGVPELASHFFIFYFGMMSMVTPPVALAAYATASIAGSKVMRTGFAAFRFALVGFTLPYMFVYRPELLLLQGSPGEILTAVVLSLGGVVALAAGLAGYIFSPMGAAARGLAFVAAALSLFPGSLAWLLGLEGLLSSLLDWTGFLMLLAIGYFSWLKTLPPGPGPSSARGIPPGS